MRSGIQLDCTAAMRESDDIVGSIKLVVSDIDGTLVTSDGVVSERTRREIERVIVSGVHFSVASGRPTRRVRTALAGLGVSVPIISSNGAVIEDLATGEIIVSLHLEHALVRRVLTIAADYEHLWSFIDTATGWRFLAGQRDLPDVLTYWVNELDAQVVDDLDHFFAEQPIVRKIVVAGEEHDLETLEPVVAALDGVYVTSSWTGNREIMVRGADKANAARHLAERLGIEPEEVLAIGDHRNDLELVAWAGTGVAMGNAAPELKEIADWITTSNDEDGVAHALQHFIPE
jgi:Cof subfamily protein (haloacid dehalogenase superfamily)